MKGYSETLAHPWHGISLGEDAPFVVNVFVEIVPTDMIKYEVDKESGHLKIDRPQKYSNICPALYGFIPRTYCDQHVANYAMKRTGKTGVQGDKDPIDICVLTQSPINHAAIILSARPTGGFRLFDQDEADDKIVAILDKDPAYAHYDDISQVPVGIIDRLRHYFLTYKQTPDTDFINHTPACQISHVYGRQEAQEVIQASLKDYEALCV